MPDLPPPDGQPVPGQPVPGQPVPGQPVPGQPVPGQPVPGQPVPGQPVPDGSAGPDPRPGPSRRASLSSDVSWPGGPETWLAQLTSAAPHSWRRPDDTATIQSGRGSGSPGRAGGRGSGSPGRAGGRGSGLSGPAGGPDSARSQGSDGQAETADEAQAALGAGSSGGTVGVGGVAGFAARGAANLLRPGPVLAGCAAGAWAGGLELLDDDELVGLICAWRRLASWAAAGEFAAVNALAQRRAVGDERAAEHLEAEVAAALTLTGRSAARLTDLAAGLARLPGTAAALRAGLIDAPRATVIADETSLLDDAAAQAVEERVLPRAPGQTTGQLRAACQRAVLAVDPRGGIRRRKKAEQDARVEAWTETAGTGALAGRDLPPAEVIAADKRIDALARWLKEHGVEGTLAQLRAKVFTAVLSGRGPETLLPGPGPSGPQANPARPGGPVPDAAAGFSGTSAGRAPAAGGASAAGPADRPGDWTGSGAGWAGRGAGRTGGGVGWIGGGGWSASEGGSGAGWPGGLSGSVNLTMPVAAWLGLTDQPGEAAGLGALDAGTCRDLAALLAAQPGSRWCVTLIGQDGRAVGHGCATGRAAGGGKRAGPRPPGRDGSDWPPGRDEGESRAGRGGDEWAGRDRGGVWTGGDGGEWLADGAGEWRAGAVRWLAAIKVSWLESGVCGHGRETAGYRPSGSLRHLVKIRDRVCSFPVCRRPAVRCDDDHTVAYEAGGRTCECNLAVLCRQHHRAKQAAGWQLAQPVPGTLIWTLPHGRRYSSTPGHYPA